MGNSVLTTLSLTAQATVARPQSWFVDVWPLDDASPAEEADGTDTSDTPDVTEGSVTGTPSATSTPTPTQVPASSDTDSSPDVFTDFFTTPGLETRSYLNDPAMPDVQVVREYDASGDVVASYTYGTERISDTASDETSEYLHDGRGSVIQTYDGTSPTNTLAYDAVGTPSEGIDGPEALFAWNAEDYDPQTGLIYLRARYYAPDLASFISRDDVLGNITDTDSTNRHVYAQGDPVNNQDPSGHAIGNTSYERQMETAGGINEIYNFYVGQSLANSYNQANVAFSARLGYAQSVSYTSLSAINSIAYISQTEANAYINQGAAQALSIGAAYGCSPGSLTMAAVNQFAADVATAKDTTNTRIANVQANKVALYNQYQVWLAEQAWLAAQAEHAALKMGAKGSVGKSAGSHSIGSYRAPMPQVTAGKVTFKQPTLQTGYTAPLSAPTAKEGASEAAQAHWAEFGKFTGKSPLEDFLSFDADSPTDAIVVDADGNNIYITIYATLHGDLQFQTFPTATNGETYRSLIISGIQTKLSGTYMLYGREVRVTTTVNTNKFQTRFIHTSVPIYLYDGLGVSTAYTQFQVGAQGESILRSTSDQGYIDIYTGDSRDPSALPYSMERYQSVAAHEMVHIFGVEDLYTHRLIGKYYAPNSDQSIMSQEWGVNASTVDMLKALTALDTNTYQFWQ